MNKYIVKGPEWPKNGLKRYKMTKNVPKLQKYVKNGSRNQNLSSNLKKNHSELPFSMVSNEFDTYLIDS